MEGSAVTAVAAAIADPVRRDIVVMLRDAPMTAGAVAARFTITRPAVSRHLRVLRETGLVVDELVGRERVYRLDTGPLAALDAWLAPFRVGWGPRLDALATEVHRTRREHAADRPSTTRPTTEERSA
jgi:DNA-binding transcriptional ArsR family regulator